MRIKFLGTGTPDFFHRGATFSKYHAQARRVGGRNWRYPTMLHVEPDCLVDFSRAAPRQMSRAGVDRRKVKHLLVTHSHEDHFDAKSIAKELARPGGLSCVYGNDFVCEEVRRELGQMGHAPDSAVCLLKPFEQVCIGDMRVIPLRANHCWVNEQGRPETALNFILQGRGASLLYLVDTITPYQETHEFLRQFTYDAVIIEATFGDRPHESLSKDTGHMNFESAGKIVEALARDGLLHEGAKRIFSHISTGAVDLHDKIAPRLAKQGYTLAYDMMETKVGGISSGKGARRTASTRSKRQAQWIWHPRQGNMENLYLYARKKVFLKSKATTAKLQCTCRDHYKLYVNGRFVGRGPSPCDPRWQYYDEHDVAGFLKIGWNIIGVLGYSAGEKMESGIKQHGGSPGLFLRGEICCEDSSRISVISDQAWRVKRCTAWMSPVSRINHWIGYREVFDAGEDDLGWNDVTLDEANERKWQLPKICTPPYGEAKGRLVAREIPLLNEENIHPKAVHGINKDAGAIRNARAMCGSPSASMYVDSTGPGSLPSVVLDFGKTVVGYPVLSFGRNSGGTCIVSYGESLDLRTYDRVILSGRPLEWSPVGRRAFRYMQLAFHGGPKPIQIRQVRLRAVSYPVEHRGNFSCSDSRLNRIWQVSRYTVEQCMQDHFEDCPTREQALWVGDVLPGSRVAYYAFGQSQLTRKCLLQTARIQHADGWIPAVGPIQSQTLIPDFCCYWVMILHEYYLYSGDKALLRELLPNLNRLVAWLRKQTNSHHLIEPRDCLKKQWWCFIDWGTLDKNGEVTALQCIYHQALLSAAAVYRVLNESGRATRCRQEAAVVKKAVNERLWDNVRVFIDCRTETHASKNASIQTNALALLYGIPDARRTEKILDYVFDNGEAVPVKTPFMNAFVAEALFRAGRIPQAIGLIRDYWGEMLKRGATTFWEEFDPRTPRSHIPLSLDENHSVVSLCHGWSGGPAYLLPAYVLGVTADSPGFRRFSVRPNPGNLKWARGTVPTPHGDITVEWEKTGQAAELRLNMSLPKGSQARVELPWTDTTRAPRLNGKRLTDAACGTELTPGIRYLATRNGRVICAVYPGSERRLDMTK